MPIKKQAARRLQAKPEPKEGKPPARLIAGPKNHRTVDRVTQILEETVYHPGMTFAELVRALGAAKSSVHGFVQGLLAKGWLFEDKHRFYLGPAAYGLTLASGHIWSGLVTQADLVTLHKATKLAVFLGVQAGDHLIYVAEAGGDQATGFEVRSNIRRTLLSTAGGKALLAARSQFEREAHLRRRTQEESELVDKFLSELGKINKTGIATNQSPTRSSFGLATIVRNRAGEAVASITLVGTTTEVESQLDKLSKVLLKHVDAWAARFANPREQIY